MSQETIEQTFEVGSPASFKLSNIRGFINIQPGDDGVIAVSAVKYLGSGKDTEIEIKQEEDGEVFIKTRYENSISNWFGLNKPCKVDYTVRVPKNCNVSTSGVSSEITVKDIEGTLDIHSVSGSLNLINLTGPLNAHTVSGAINAENITGTLDLNSVSGSVRVMESQLPEVVAKTVSGKMIVQTPLANGPYMFKGVSGNVTLVVPEDTGCVAHHKSVSGRLKTSLPVTKDQRYGSRGLAEIQNGGSKVTHKSVSGNLRIVTSENEKIVEKSASPTPSRPQQDQMAILKKIENGDLSVEDALEKLNA